MLFLVAFFLLIFLVVSHMSLNFILNIPQSFVSETCSEQFRNPRPVPPLNMVILMWPTVYSAVSLTTDIVMIRFLRKTMQVQRGVTSSNVWTTNVDQEQLQGKLIFLKERCDF